MSAADLLARACGHTIAVPDFMGRGEARKRRLAQWAALGCRACREARIRDLASRLTDPRGVPVPDHVREAFVARHVARMAP